MSKIVVVDDSYAELQMIEGYLKSANHTVVSYPNTDKLEDKLAADKPDVIVLDVVMPGRNGLEVLRYLKSTHPNLPVLVFSMHPESQYAVRAFKAGAAGYLTKDSIPEELVTAIRKVVAGRRYVSPTLAEYLVFEVARGPEAPLHVKLSDRELQVHCMIGSGKRVTDIARELSLSVKTISTHRSRLLEKMHMRTSAELIHYAVHHQLVQ